MTASFQREVGIQICIIKNIKIYKELLSDVLLHSFHTAYISFWIPKRQKYELRLKYKREKIQRALSELPDNWSSQFSQKDWFLNIKSLSVSFFGLSLGYSEQDKRSAATK